MTILPTFFEDSYLENFHPLTLTRPLYDLRVGVLTLGQKWAADLESHHMPSGPLRAPLEGVFPEPHRVSGDRSSYWINSRVFPNRSIAKKIKGLPKDTAIFDENILIAAHAGSDIHTNWLQNGIDTAQIERIEHSEQISMLNYAWQIFQVNSREIVQDIKRLDQGTFISPNKFEHVVAVNSDEIYIEEGATIEPGTVLMADEGPIYIGKNARIMANSVIRGTTAICKNSVVKVGSKIYAGTTIGPVCKVGGEIANVLFHSYSNKAHDGFAGNSVFGQWCNLGADTNTSNLKNNYSDVRIRSWATDNDMDTGQQFLGTIMGDHSKTGINTMLNTGTLCGVCCNLFSEGYQPKFVPSFSWVSTGKIVPYKFDKAVEAMEKMMERRDIVLTPSYKQMMLSIFKSIH